MAKFNRNSIPPLFMVWGNTTCEECLGSATEDSCCKQWHWPTQTLQSSLVSVQNAYRLCQNLWLSGSAVVLILGASTALKRTLRTPLHLSLPLYPIQGCHCDHLIPSKTMYCCSVTDQSLPFVQPTNHRS